MEPFILLAVGAVGALVAGLSGRRKRRRRAELWRRSAEACGLTGLIESGGVLRGRLRQGGGRDDLVVTIREYHGGQHDRGTRLVMTTPDMRLAGLRLHTESLGTDLRRMFGANEIEIGDPIFDAQFFIGGQATPSLAFLDAEMRRLLTDLKPACRRLEIARGDLQVDVRETSDLPTVLPAVLYRMLEIGRRWPPHSQTTARIAHNALRDPQIGVRLHNLLVLIRERGDEPGAQDALRAACDDPWPEIRLRAASALGPKAHDVLFAMAEGAEDDVAAKAVGALGRWLSQDRATTILEEAMRHRRDATAAACIALLGRIGGDAAVARLKRILDAGVDDLKVAAVRALGWSAHPAAEAALIDGLRHPLAELRLTSAVALAQIGTAAAVLPLREAAERDPALWSTARQSVAAIQSRATGAAPGQLSVSGAESGQLSLAAGGAGQVSLAEEPGRLTVRDEEERR